MTLQSDNKSRSLWNNLWAQMALLSVVAFILIVLAAKFVW
jgi:hypothetical protein